MIASLLIANRGEIACRVIRTARAMGVRTIAVCSAADAGALHVRRADAAVPIGPSPATESYLRGDRIIAAAVEVGAQAIHPGYGFLSENADFAQAVIDAGLIWVGPAPASIRAMGLKDAAKARMIAAGVPVTPGYLGEDQSPDRLAAEASRIGFPVLVKAVAGGGGKGMRRVDAAADFADALASCRREAAAAFGDDRVLIERYVRSPRHIEVQVFGDRHGDVVHLFERDCSLQRRHQKVIEEAPAPGMNEATRAAICDAAVRAAKAVDYVGAGTIEFIADASEGLRADRIWFMEMNTRLQVEHPVTEAITGVDLVEWQLRVASGEPLPRRQDQLAINGHAIEARLYAEDPARGFLPSVGRLERFVIPQDLDDESYIAPATGMRHRFDHPGEFRIETGVEQGDAVTPYYDPMIAKLICHAERRRDAAQGLASLAQRVECWPVRTNAQFLHALLVHPDYTAARIDTGFIAGHAEEAILDEPPPQWLLDRVSAVLAEGVAAPGPIGFRLNAEPEHRVRMTDGDAVYEGWIGAARPSPGAAPWLSIARNDDGVFASILGHTWRFGLRHANTARGGESGSDGALRAPMPGRITAIEVAAGDHVAAGQRVVALEAMKMEHALSAPFAGVVAELGAAVGAQVAEGALLARIEPVEER